MYHLVSDEDRRHVSPLYRYKDPASFEADLVFLKEHFNLARYSMTMHLVAGVVIDLAGDVAAAESTGVAVHRSDDPAPHLNLMTGFRYLDRFERRDGRWAIAERTAVGEWSLSVDADRWWPMPTDHPAGRRDADDPLYALLGSLPDSP